MSPYSPISFIPAHLKIKRAREHIDQFDSYLTETFADKRFAPYMTTHVIDPDSGDLIEKVFAVPEIIEQCALICGDAIHNLRTALDLAWHEATQADSVVPLHKNRFPVYPSRENLEAFIKGREKQQSVTRISNELLNSIQPYKGSNTIGNLIYALHQLDIRDKHQLLIQQMQISDVVAVGTDDRNYEGMPVVYGDDIRNTYGAENKNQAKISASIIFGKGCGLGIEGRPVNETLKGFETAVKTTLWRLWNTMGYR
jgi:hypothetical protein